MALLRLLQENKHPNSFMGFFIGKEDYNDLPAENLTSEMTKKQICTRIYPLEVLHKKFADTLNVVIIHLHF